MASCNSREPLGVDASASEHCDKPSRLARMSREEAGSKLKLTL
eukprot:CAMPEP_0115464582 /NCGR_PEP_ID=MMETSP0271-20121206/48952_1 /TAXON_ID=71861 /ORGANISM="Scrippsiella trochoidea, Strain CCMP3099" /LENGTH=42 /DNA_ID= /DNA_START= /DNA_END= /DNA_ORIENTATION=